MQFLSKGVVAWTPDGQVSVAIRGGKQRPGSMATPVARGDYVYAAANRIGGGLVRLKASSDGVAAEQVYFTRGLPNNIGGSVLVAEYLYGTTAEGLVAAEFLSGKIKWQEKSIGTSSITSADGLLYLHGENGDVALVEASPEGYREKGRFTPPEQPKHRNAGEKSWAYPVVARGRLYIRDGGALWAYEVGATRGTK